MFAQIYKENDQQVNQGGGTYYRTANFYIRTFELDIDAYVPVDGNGAVAVYQKRTVYNGSTVGTPQQFTVTLYNDPILIFPESQIYKSHGAINYDLEQVFEIVSFTPPCDIDGTVIHTDETAPFANDGTVTFNVTSSYEPIQYTVDLITFQSSPVFTGLSPGSYTVQARDANGCRFGRSITIDAFPLPVDKQYVMQYNTIKDNKSVEVRIYPPNASEDIETVYIQGSAIKSYKNDTDDKYGSIRASSLDITFLYEGSFDIAVFSTATERQFKVDVLYDGIVDFQGWLLSDQVTEPYLDAPYDVQLTATDGLASLKGQEFGGLNDERLFGITSVLNCFKYIFNNLGYDYGETTLISSLKAVQASSLVDQWGKLSVWAEMFYDSEGTPVDCYTALQKILGNHLVCYQHKGSFVLVHQNDLVLDVVSPYSLNIASEFASVSMGVNTPSQQVISLQTENKPANVNQTLFRKSAFSILDSNAEFNLLSLLYPDPGFEFNQTVGQLPVDFTAINGGIPNTYITNTDFYEGVNSFRVGASGNYPGYSDKYVRNATAFVIDQPNKKLKLSLKFKVPNYTVKFDGNDLGLIISVGIVFVSSGGQAYFMWRPDTRIYSIFAGINTGAIPNYVPDTETWVTSDSIIYPGDLHTSEGPLPGLKSQTVTDFNAWNDFSVETPVFPSNSGVAYVLFYGAKAIPYDSSVTLAPNPSNNNRFIYLDVLATDGYYLVDDLNITIGDASDDYNLQLSETHRFNNLGKYNFSPKEVRDFDLFTYAENKRVAGNLFYGLTYVTAQISNAMWKFLSFPSDPNDRYPAAISRAITRGLKQPYYIFEGEIQSDDIDFFTVFIIDQLSGRKFIALSMDVDYRNSMRRVTLAEHNNSAANTSYQYIPKYQKSARKNE